MQHVKWGLIGLALVALISTHASAQTDGATVPGDASGVLDQVQAQVPPEAQTTQTLPTGILVLNQDRLLAQSEYGQRIQSELEAAAQALTLENREIEAQLTAEELRLTELRPTTAPDEFRVMAEEFDVRVEGIRSAQEAKGRDLQSQADTAQARFFEIATPILLDIVRTRGAAVLLDNRGVLLSADAIDITDDALARINAEIGDGGPDPLVNFEIGRDGQLSDPNSD